MPIDFRRQATAKRLLAIDWTLPVWAPDLAEQQEEGRTYGGRARTALPREEAIAAIRAEDRRPLLVVRECRMCQGTDDALLSRRLDNEKTILLTRWFRCVKLPNHVLDADHAFRKLFPDEHPPHLFLCRYDGTGVVPMSGQQSQAELWQAMTSLLAEDYTGDPEVAVKGLLRVLNEYDTVDSRESELRQRYEESLDAHGPNHSKSKSLARKLADLAKRRAAIQKTERELSDLGLLPLEPPKASSTRG
jgi:hypothetical protein